MDGPREKRKSIAQFQEGEEYSNHRKKERSKGLKHWSHLAQELPYKHTAEEKLEEKIEVTRIRRKKRKQTLDGLKETRGWWKLKEEKLDRTLWRTRFGRSHGPVVKTDCGIHDTLERRHVDFEKAWEQQQE